MRLRILYTLIFVGAILLSGYSQQSKSLFISGSYQNIPFDTFVELIEDDLPVKFFYKSDWVKGVNVSITTDSLSLDEALDRIFIASFSGFFIDENNNVYIVPDKNMVTTLPIYTREVADTDKVETSTENLAIEEKYIRGRQPDMLETIYIGDANQRKNRKSTISGKITDAKTGEPVIGATVYIKELGLGAVSDRYGNTTLIIPSGKYEASFQCLGMADATCMIHVYSSGYFELQMTPQLTSIAEVTVVADESYRRGAKPGLEKVAMKSVKELPTLMGEKDVMKIAQLLPGVVSVSEGASGVNVRGGNVDQNLFYLNKIPVYNSSHLFGFFSAINTSIINDFSLYKGLVPAEYGGRLSSVFDVDTRTGNKNKFYAQGGISPVSAQASVEIPLVKNKASLLLSGRSSYSDWILTRLDDPALRNSNANFHDFAAGVDYVLNENNHLNIFGYYSYDFFNMNNLTDYSYTNKGGAINHHHRFNPGLSSELTLVASSYEYNTTDKNAVSTAYSHGYKLNHTEFKFSMGWQPNEKHKIGFGGSAINYQLDRGIVEPYGIESKRQWMDLGKENGIEAALFVDESYSPVYWLNIYGGIRYSYFAELGPKSVYQYQEGAPVHEYSVVDSATYTSGEVISTYQGPEFRASIDFKLTPENSIKVSYMQMRQYLFMLSNTIAVAPGDQWKLSDSHITPPKSHQYSLGYYLNLKESGIGASVETYYKQAENIVEYKDGADFLESPYAERTVLQGDQSAYGIEFMLSKNNGKLTGWISYAFSRSIITVDGENPWDKINDGNSYAANYDKPHVFNVVASYRINRRISLSTNLAYSTGRPLTLPENVFYARGIPFIEYSARNEYRIPNYFRMDISLTVDGNLKRQKLSHSYWVFSVYNLTGRKNPTSVYFMSENRRLLGYQYAVIGVPIPTITWNFKLGNYANN